MLPFSGEEVLEHGKSNTEFTKMKVLGQSLLRCVLLDALKNQVSHELLNFWLFMKDLKVWQTAHIPA